MEETGNGWVTGLTYQKWMGLCKKRHSINQRLSYISLAPGAPFTTINFNPSMAE